MATYSSLQREIARLQQQAEIVRKQELASVISGVKKTVSKYNLLASDIFDDANSNAAQIAVATDPTSTSSKGTKAKATSDRSQKVTKKTRAPATGAGVAKYLNPKTKQTWSGFGRAPAWIASAKNRDKFLVPNESVEAAAPNAVPAAVVNVAPKQGKVVSKKAVPAKKKTVAAKAVVASEKVELETTPVAVVTGVAGDAES